MKRILLLCLLLGAWTASAQVTTATLGGRITDENGPIEGVTVVVINTVTNAQYYATTGRGGWYQLHDIVPGGPFTVRIHYFGYDPMTVRNISLYAGQNTVVDVDLEAGTSRVVCDEAATAMRLGEVNGQALGGGEVALSPLTYLLLSQRTYTEVPIDVRQEATLTGVSRLQLPQMGSQHFHASAYGFYGSGLGDGKSLVPGYGLGGLTVSTPLWSEDYQVFAGLQYGGGATEGGLFGLSGLSGAARLDARLNERFHLDLSGGRLSAQDAWAATGLTASLGETGSMRLQTGWYDDGGTRQMLTSDDFAFSAGRHRMLAGVQFAYQQMPALDSSASRGSVYVQDAIRFGRRVTVLAGIRFIFPFAFSPRASVYYDVLGNSTVVLRAGTAVYGRPGGSTWKNLGAVDVALPLQFRLSLEATYGQLIKQLFYIKQGNVVASQYAFTARLERPLTDNCWAVASYTYAGGDLDGLVSTSPGSATRAVPIPHRLIGGFSYRVPYLDRQATMLSVLYTGLGYHNGSASSLSWTNSVEARLTQDIAFSTAGRDHTLQLTAHLRYAPAPDNFHYTPANASQFLVGIRYLL